MKAIQFGAHDEPAKVLAVPDRPVPEPGRGEVRVRINLSTPSELMGLLEIQFDEITPTGVTGSIAADERHHQPWGSVHGGLYATAIETFATTGAFEAVKDRGQRAVGVANATDFLRPHQSGRLAVVAVPIHQGRTQQLWHVEIRRTEDDQLIARGQVRLQNVGACA